MQAQPVVNGAFEVTAEIEPQDRLAHFDDSDDTDTVGDFDYLNQSQTKQSRVISPGNCLSINIESFDINGISSKLETNNAI